MNAKQKTSNNNAISIQPTNTSSTVQNVRPRLPRNLDEITVILPTNEPTIYQRIMKSRREAAMAAIRQARENASITTDNTPSSSSSSSNISSSHHSTNPSTTMRQTLSSPPPPPPLSPPPIVSAPRTLQRQRYCLRLKWTYNEEGDEEEEYGFKKEFFYNNENFWSKYR